MIKKVVDLNFQSNFSFRDFHYFFSKVFEKTMTKEVYIFPLSYDAVMKLIQEGKLFLNDMENDMKILQSKFYHFYTEDMKEIIIQIHNNKMVIFFEE